MSLKATEVFVPGAYPQHTYVIRKAETPRVATRLSKYTWPGCFTVRAFKVGKDRPGRAGGGPRLPYPGFGGITQAS